jgi:hypothetical protein
MSLQSHAAECMKFLAMLQPYRLSYKAMLETMLRICDVIDNFEFLPSMSNDKFCPE